ncbi:MAG: hypothetical protein M5U23_05095 [Acidimicrobiia bacterium]|nr:hypothetical protein [Acidimicrobiia bacterium]
MAKKKWFGFAAIAAAIGAAVAVVTAKSKSARDKTGEAVGSAKEKTGKAVDVAKSKTSDAVEATKATVAKATGKKPEATSDDVTSEGTDEGTDSKSSDANE